MNLPRQAWAVQTLDGGFDGIGVVVAKTAAGARGFVRDLLNESGFANANDLDISTECLYSLNRWAATEPLRKVKALNVAIREALGEALADGA